MSAGPHRQSVLGMVLLSPAAEIAIPGAVSKTCPFTPHLHQRQKQQELVSLTGLQRDLYAAIRPSRHLLELGPESAPKHERKCTQRNIFVLKLRATVRQLLPLRPRSVNCANRADLNITGTYHEF
jgi:hypothetical protein